MAEILRDFYYSLYSGSLKFFVRSVGHFKLKRTFEEPRKLEKYGEILWCIEGSAYFQLGEKMVLLQPNQVLYYPPGSVQRFKPGRHGFHFRMLSLEGERVEELFDSLGLQPGVQTAGDCPEDLFSSIEQGISSSSHAKRLEILAKAFQILTLAASCPEKVSNQDLVNDMKNYVDNNYQFNDLNVCRMAEVYHIHRVVLNRKFKAAYDISLSDYIIAKRLHEALDLLKNSSLALSEIARKCGFSSSVYFNKAIRKATGRPPGKLRELFAV